MATLSNIITPTNLVTATSTTTLTNKTLTAPTFDGTPDGTATTFIGAAGALMDSEVTNLAQIKAFDTADYATAAQGTTADSALQSGDLASAGALMDSEVTNLAQVKAFDTSDYATAAQGSTADTALQSGTIGSTVQGYDVDTLKADTADNLTAAFTAAVDDDGTLTTGTYTPTTAAGSNYKKIINGGAFTIAPPALATNTATTLSLFIVNNASAGAITTSGFTMVNGDAFTTTNGDEFLCRIEVFDIGGTEFSLFNVVAMQ
jgi:uncharacterized protein YqgQ